MTKYEWFKEFKNNLKDVPKEELDKAIEYYEELFEDKIDAGKSENEAILEFGSPSIASRRIRNEIIDDTPKTESFNMGVGGLYESVNEKVDDIDLNEEIKTKEPKTKTNKEEKQEEGCCRDNNNDVGRTIIFMLELFVFGIAYFVCFVTFWSLIVSLFACMISFIVGGIGGFIASIVGIFTVGVEYGFFSMGSCLILLSLGLLIVAFLKPVIKGSITLTKKSYNMFFGWYTKNMGGNK